MSALLVHPLLAEWRVSHGFGTRDTPEPGRLARPRQVHGRAVARLLRGGEVEPADADAIVADEPGARVGVVTADCVPVLLAAPGGERVAAVHAGWRGLAAGVIEAAVATLADSGSDPAALRAAIGPCIGPCCYEIDAPVIDALQPRYGAELEAALQPAPGTHRRLDLGALARAALVAAGVPARAVGGLPDACTRCDARRFHSYRRDGPRAGRLVHWIEVRGAQG